MPNVNTGCLKKSKRFSHVKGQGDSVLFGKSSRDVLTLELQYGINI